MVGSCQVVQIGREDFKARWARIPRDKVGNRGKGRSIIGQPTCRVGRYWDTTLDYTERAIGLVNYGCSKRVSQSGVRIWSDCGHLARIELHSKADEGVCRGGTRSDIVVEGYAQVVLYGHATRIVNHITRWHWYDHILGPINRLSKIGSRGHSGLVCIVECVRDGPAEGGRVSIRTPEGGRCHRLERGEGALEGRGWSLNYVEHRSNRLGYYRGSRSCASIHYVKPNLFLLHRNSLTSVQ